MVDEVSDAIATAQAIRDGELSTREVVDTAISRIEKHNPELNAVVHTRFDQALAEVRDGLPDGPLQGVPILVKDLHADVAGLPSTGGSRLFADVRAAQDSAVVARYRKAGMVVLGTTNTPELGKNASTESLLYGPARNPWELTHSPGGSSGGSAAAVASGMVPVAHGTDGGGSIRIPSSMCGLFGLKPSRGRASDWPYPASLAAPVSVHHALTTTVRDSALLLDIAAGPVPGDAYGAPAPEGSFLEQVGREPGRLRIGYTTAAVDGIQTDPACVAALERAVALCAELGHEPVEVTLDYDVIAAMAASGLIMGATLVANVEARLAELGRELRDDDLEPFTRVMFENYRTSTAAQLAQALQTAQETGWQIGTMFADYDVLLTPTISRPVPPLGTLDTTDPAKMYEVASAYSVFTSLFNVTGQPAMSVPFGTTDSGLPLGVQFAADLGQEALLLRLAGQLEQAATWPRRAPRYREA